MSNSPRPENTSGLLRVNDDEIRIVEHRGWPTGKLPSGSGWFITNSARKLHWFDDLGQGSLCQKYVRLSRSLRAINVKTVDCCDRCTRTLRKRTAATKQP